MFSEAYLSQNIFHDSLPEAVFSEDADKDL